MGICASSRRVQQEEDSDENVVYVMDEQGGGGADGDGHGRKVASLFSHKGKKGPNQDAVILCQVRARTALHSPLCLPPAAAVPRLVRSTLFRLPSPDGLFCSSARMHNQFTRLCHHCPSKKMILSNSLFSLL
jgi:hypothetical protein